MLLGRIGLAHPRSDERERERHDQVYSLVQPNSEFVAQPNRGVEHYVALVYLYRVQAHLCLGSICSPDLQKLLESREIPTAESQNRLYGDLYILVLVLPVPALLTAQRRQLKHSGRALTRSGGGRSACSRPVLLLACCWWPTPAGDSRDRDVLTWTGRPARPLPCPYMSRNGSRSFPSGRALAIISTDDESGALSSPTVQFPVDASAMIQYVQIIPGHEICGEEERTFFFQSFIDSFLLCDTTHTTNQT